VGEAFRKFPWIGPWLRGGIISFIFLYKKRVFYGVVYILLGLLKSMKKSRIKWKNFSENGQK